ncbi:MAG: O-antigen ligase family protein, partial [Hyphomicrobiales bacterium]
MSDPDEIYNPQGTWLASALFAGVFFYFWLGLAPLSDMSGGSLAAYGESSNSLNQLVVFGMSFLVMTMLALHPARILALKALAPLGLVFFWVAVTIAFSDTPDAALRRTIYSILVCICASAVLLLPRDNVHFAKLVGFCLLVAVSLSYFGVIVLPARAIHQASDLSEQFLAGDWRGHFGHKNVAAAAMAFAVFFGLYLLRMKMVWMGLALTGLAAFFLLNSGGKTSAAMLPAVLVAAWLFERLGPLRLVLVGGVLIAINFVILSVAVSPEINAFVTGLG